ncbi:sigma-70 family RNA polymerase sigma factor [Paenibacillus sp. GSMTC-2017]|uniref:RNA polymerase sigma factor n=1 Tax=Paenibacillus sp. GSMTC-2017 TaxID=2794350 RepID=UPI0018D68FCC|nr:RNA polymerase sigma factor [Paenibacillus sp. GSMTC-2017]MBH5319594.1 sigma-70 family RNA polymerase sigma factor [Paenibacillus sp. GSMTC-2017]
MNIDRGKSDEQLVIEALSGNFDAFRSIVLRYSNALLSVAFHVARNYHNAQDITQEAFMKSYNQLHTLNEPSKLGSWLYSITSRTSHDFIRRKKTNLPFSDDIIQHSDNVQTWLDGHVVHESIWTALHTLDEKNKSAISLFTIPTTINILLLKIIDPLATDLSVTMRPYTEIN